MPPTSNQAPARRRDGRVRVVSTGFRPTSLRQALAIRMENLLWRSRAEAWDEEGSAQLGPVVRAVLDACEAGPDTVAVDLGCGSGQVALPLGRSCAHVIAVDLSAPAVELLKERAARLRLTNVHSLVQPIESFEVAPESVDLVVSNYALHHLRDADKAQFVRLAFEWLRPGGRLVIGDMMIGRGASREDRAIIRAKVQAFARRGPAGWWRILKNAWRLIFRLQEKPLALARWVALVRQAGFEEINAQRVVAEACVLSARRPDRGQHLLGPSASSGSASVGQVLTAGCPRPSNSTATSSCSMVG
jgi:SAM-dependent methyltransferase